MSLKNIALMTLAARKSRRHQEYNQGEKDEITIFYPYDP
jgi:hypothetical protein